MRTHLAIWIGVLSAVARPAVGAELLLGWDAEVVWDSNVFGTADQTADGVNIPKEDDFSIRSGPDLRVRESQGDLVYDLSYRPRYQEFARLDGIGALDQFASGSGRWSITQRTEVSFEDQFGYTSSLGGLFQEVPATIGTIIVAPVRERITTNTARAGLVHRLGRLWEVRFDGSHDLYDFKNPEQSDAFSYAGALSLTRGVTPRLIVGGGVQYQRQEFSGGLTPDNDSGTSFYQAFGIVNYKISPTWNISFNAGPAYSDPDQPQTFETTQVRRYFAVDPRTCPAADGVRVIRVFPQDDSDLCQERSQYVFTDAQGGESGVFVAPASEFVQVPFTGEQGVEGSLTYFGRISMQKTWREWNAILSYQRSASSGSGLGTSTTLDLLTGELRWAPSSRWNISLLGTVSRQEAVNELRQTEILVQTVFDRRLIFDENTGALRPVEAAVAVPFEITSGDPIDNALSIRQYRVELRAERRITRNLMVDGSASWWQQTTSNLQVDSDRTLYRFVVGVTWTFDPIPL